MKKKHHLATLGSVKLASVYLMCISLQIFHIMVGLSGNERYYTYSTLAHNLISLNSGHCVPNISCVNRLGLFLPLSKHSISRARPPDEEKLKEKH